MTATISKWGNSQGLRFSKEILDSLNLCVGDKVNIYTNDDKVIIEPIREHKKYDITQLVKDIPTDYKASEEFDNKSGSEIW